MFIRAQETMYGLKGENLSAAYGEVFSDTMSRLGKRTAKTNFRYHRTAWNAERAMFRAPRQQLGAAGEVVTAAATASNGLNVTLTPREKDCDFTITKTMFESVPVEVKTATGTNTFVFTGLDLQFEKAHSFIVVDPEFATGRAAWPLMAYATSSELLEMGVPKSGSINLNLAGTGRSKTHWLVERLTAPHVVIAQLRKFAADY